MKHPLLSEVVTVLRRGGLVPVTRLSDLEDSVPRAAALPEGGAAATELTITSAGMGEKREWALLAAKTGVFVQTIQQARNDV